jgi:hypothetical protein
VAFELTDTWDDSALPRIIFDNTAGFNGFRGTAIRVALTPLDLDLYNDISRNLGENRSHGPHPRTFLHQ